jgi:DNA-binding MarR family transcriptional regulator
MDRLRNFGFLVKDVSRLSALNFERHAEATGLTLAQWKVMAYLKRHQGITQVRLAELTDTDPMTLVRLLDRMERDGWVERRPDPEDRRARRLYLLPSAEPLLRRMWPMADRARAEALAGLSEPEREQLMNMLELIHSNLEALVGGPARAEPPAAPARKRRTAQ